MNAVTNAVTIIVPTYLEADNIDPLLRRIQAVQYGWDCTVLFVDDSPDTSTVNAVVSAAEQLTTPSFQMQIYRRPADMAWGGLAGAVTDGLRRATTPYTVVMDADLQHPPEILPDMLRALSGHDLVVASRYRPGGSSGGLHSPVRHAVSRASTYAAKLLFPAALRGITDPMSGCFALRMDAISPENLEPRGFKILLETVVRHPALHVTEVPLQFAPRHSGDSKGTFRQGLNYLQHLLVLRGSSWRRTLKPAFD